MDIAAFIQSLAISALPIVFAITLHEAAHGYVARLFGDPTAWMLGRISANPLRHIDPVGTLLVPAIIVFTSYVALDSVFIFGWAKPVPVNFGKLRNPKRDMLWVAGAGPAANLAMALLWALVFKLVTLMSFHDYSLALAEMARIGIGVNIGLMVLNLLPLPPLDGGRIAVSLLPYPLAVRFAQLERWGFAILLVLLFTGLLGDIMRPFVAALKKMIIFIFF